MCGYCDMWCWDEIEICDRLRWNIVNNMSCVDCLFQVGLLEKQRELCRNFYRLELLSDLRVGIRDRYSNERRRHIFSVVPYGVTGRDVTWLACFWHVHANHLNYFKSCILIYQYKLWYSYGLLALILRAWSIRSNLGRCMKLQTI